MADLIVPERHRVAHHEGLARFMSTPEPRVLNRRIEITARRRDGTKFPVELSITTLREGEHNLFTAYVRDITERKRAEAELRIAATAFESQEGMMITDARGVILRVNQAFTRITGYSGRGSRGPDAAPAQVGPPRRGLLSRRCGRPSSAPDAWQGEIWNRRKNGEVYPEWLTITAVKDDDGQRHPLRRHAYPTSPQRKAGGGRDPAVWPSTTR